MAEWQPSGPGGFRVDMSSGITLRVHGDGSWWAMDGSEEGRTCGTGTAASVDAAKGAAVDAAIAHVNRVRDAEVKALEALRVAGSEVRAVSCWAEGEVHSEMVLAGIRLWVWADGRWDAQAPELGRHVEGRADDREGGKAAAVDAALAMLREVTAAFEAVRAAP